MIYGLRSSNPAPLHGAIVKLMVPSRASHTGIDWQDAKYDSLSDGFVHLATGRFYPMACRPLWQE